MRESLFNALSARDLVRGRVLDLYAGSGALGFEALSRGADPLVSVERDRAAAKQWQKNADALGLDARAQLLVADLTDRQTQKRLYALGPYDLVFADPPYAQLRVAITALQSLLPACADQATIVLEHDASDSPLWPVQTVPTDATLESLATYRYGATALQLWRVHRPAASP